MRLGFAPSRLGAFALNPRSLRLVVRFPECLPATLPFDHVGKPTTGQFVILGRTMARRQETGIPIDAGNWKPLVELAERLGVTVPTTDGF